MMRCMWCQSAAGVVGAEKDPSLILRVGFSYSRMDGTAWHKNDESYAHLLKHAFSTLFFTRVGIHST